MFKLKRSNVGKTDGFRTQVKNMLGENASVFSQNHETILQSKDLNEVSMKGETCTASKEQFKLEELPEESIACEKPVAVSKRPQYDYLLEAMIDPIDVEDARRKVILPRDPRCLLCEEKKRHQKRHTAGICNKKGPTAMRK